MKRIIIIVVVIAVLFVIVKGEKMNRDISRYLKKYKARGPVPKKKSPKKQRQLKLF